MVRIGLKEGYKVFAVVFAAVYRAIKLLMKIIEQWLLFKYIDGQFVPLSKPYKTKDQAEKARLKYPHRERGSIGVGVIRIKK
jgi:hypothetical protein